MLSLRCRWQPAAACDALRVKESVQYVFRDDEEVLDGSQPRVFLRRAAVNVRSTRWIVLDDGGPDFS